MERSKGTQKTRVKKEKEIEKKKIKISESEKFYIYFGKVKKALAKTDTIALVKFGVLADRI